MYRSSHGFTLVELLVVITIIGFLMALIIPAVNMVREDSRQTKCMNNQRELGQAIVMYESAKKHLPAVLNPAPPGGAEPYTWVEAIFPYLEHGDMWEALSIGNTGIATERVAVTVCPNDPYAVDPTSQNAQALLSYGINDGFFVSNVSGTANFAPPVDRNGYPAQPTTLSKLTSRPNTNFPRGQEVSPSTTIMIGERTGSAMAASMSYLQNVGSYPTGPGKWVYPNLQASTPYAQTAWKTLTFPWPANTSTPPTLPTPPTPVTISPNIMVSNHPNKVIVIFFDGHGDKLLADSTTLYPQ